MIPSPHVNVTLIVQSTTMGFTCTYILDIEIFKKSSSRFIWANAGKLSSVFKMIMSVLAISSTASW